MNYLMLIVVIGLIVSVMVVISDDPPQERRIIDINSIYHKYGHDGDMRFTNTDALTSEFTPSGAVKIWNQGNRLVGAYGLGYSGIVNGTQLIRTSADFAWSWWMTNETILYNDTIYTYDFDVPEDEDAILISAENVTYRYIKYTMNGYNNYPAFPIIQYFEFTPQFDLKITQSAQNNLWNITNMVFWYINPLESTTQIIFNDILYTPQLNDTIYWLGGNYNDIIPRVKFVGAHTFMYDDLFPEYTMNGIIVGNASIFGFPNVLIFAGGFTKNDGIFNLGETWELDPASSGWRDPYYFKIGDPYDDWTDGTNVTDSDNFDAKSTGHIDGRRESIGGFGFIYRDVVPEGAIIVGHAFRIKAIGRTKSLCAGSELACINGSISWDGGDSNTTGWWNCWGCTGSDSYKIYGNSSYLWGREWNSTELTGTDFAGAPDPEIFNYIFMMNFDKSSTKLINFDHKDAGVDHVQAMVYYMLCAYDCGVDPSLDEDIDCMGENLTFVGSGTAHIESGTSYTNISQLQVTDCRLAIDGNITYAGS